MALLVQSQLNTEFSENVCLMGIPKTVRLVNLYKREETLFFWVSIQLFASKLKVKMHYVNCERIAAKNRIASDE